MRYGGNRMKQFFDEIRLEVIKAVKKRHQENLKTNWRREGIWGGISDRQRLYYFVFGCKYL